MWLVALRKNCANVRTSLTITVLQNGAKRHGKNVKCQGFSVLRNHHRRSRLRAFDGAQSFERSGRVTLRKRRYTEKAVWNLPNSAV
jgi:hypothetical protein